MLLVFLSPTDPLVSLHSDLDLPVVKEDSTEEKSPRLKGSKFKVRCLEKQRASSVYVQKQSYNFPIKKATGKKKKTNL